MKEADLKKELAAIKATKATFKGVYVVYFKKIGSESTGAYLVKGATSVVAKRIVKEIDPSVVVQTPCTFIQYCEDNMFNPFDKFTDVVKRGLPGDNILITRERILPHRIVWGFTSLIASGT